MFSSPAYGNRVKAFALANCALFIAFQFAFAFTPGAWFCALVGVGAATWYRITARPVEQAALQQPGVSA